MELGVLQLDRLALAAAGALEQHLVVEAQPQLGHSRQVDPHLDAADDLTAQHVTVRVGLQNETARSTVRRYLQLVAWADPAEWFGGGQMTFGEG